MLDGLLIRFFEDETSRELLDNYHPMYIPRDIVTPHLFSLQIIKQLTKAHPKIATFAVVKNNRVLLSTMGPFMTNFCSLYSAINNQEIYNKKIAYIFGAYF